MGEKFALGCARFIEDKLFKTTLPPEEVAAIFVEPIQGEGGYVVAPSVFTLQLWRICDLSWNLACGGRGPKRRRPYRQMVGRSSTPACSRIWFASGEGHRFRNAAQGITMARADIMDWVPGSHASTFGGNPVCIAAALATLDVIEREHLLPNATAVGDHMQQRMAEWP